MGRLRQRFDVDASWPENYLACACQKVVFMPIGAANAEVQDWQQGGLAFGKLNDAIALIKKNGLAFDLVLYH